jgi:hypothetical protein
MLVPRYREARFMMSYLLPRAALVITLWGMSCTLIKHLWPPAGGVIFAIAAASWAIAATVYFAYLRKLRRDIEGLERNHIMRTGWRPDPASAAAHQAAPARFQPRARLP